MTKRTVIIGVGGPVGSGKTLLLERLTRRMSDLNLAVITNDIYTKEDALKLFKSALTMIWMLFSLKVVETTWLRPSALIWLILPFILLTLLRVKKSHVRLVKG